MAFQYVYGWLFPALCRAILCSVIQGVKKESLKRRKQKNGLNYIFAGVPHAIRRVSVTPAFGVPSAAAAAASVAIHATLQPTSPLGCARAFRFSPPAHVCHRGGNKVQLVQLVDVFPRPLSSIQLLQEGDCREVRVGKVRAVVLECVCMHDRRLG